MARRTQKALAAAVLLGACSPQAPAQHPVPPGTAAPDVRTAEGRPPVVLVAREGDPAAAIAIAATTADVPFDTGEDSAEPAAALAGLLEARLARQGLLADVVPAWDGVRVTALAAGSVDVVRVASALRDAFLAPAAADDLVAARRKLVALGTRPIADRAYTGFARCTGDLRAPPERAGKDYAEVDLGRLERWRTSAFGLGRVAVAVTGPRPLGESAARAILGGPAWRAGLALSPRVARPVVEVVASSAEAAPTVRLTLAAGSSSAAVAIAEALGDGRGPLAARLGELEVPFRVREIVGAAHPDGGCVGVVLESNRPMGADVAARVADAAALVELEASAHRAGSSGGDGAELARRAGDARASAERAAWWALADRGGARKPGPTSVVLALPGRGTGGEPPTSSALAGALITANATWSRPVVEGRSRLEPGQGETWMLLASPCGTDSETDAESGLSALVATATAEARSDGVAIEPWAATDGVGLVVHGPALRGESPVAHARRLADVAGRAFAAEPLAPPVIGRARTELLWRDARSDGPLLAALGGALAPHHAGWVLPWGTAEPLARSADAAVLARAQALRSGPLRLAVLANDDAAQVDAAVHAADRWVPRRTGDARACPAPAGAEPAAPGTYAAPLRSGALPAAYLAFPFAAGDEPGEASARLLATALESGGLLANALGPLARETSARVLGWPRAPALVIRVAGPQGTLDDAVMQARGLVDVVHKNGLGAPDLERAWAASEREALVAGLEPRARLVGLWRGARPARRVSAEELRAFAGRWLGEESMVVVAARPGRLPPPIP